MEKVKKNTRNTKSTKRVRKNDTIELYSFNKDVIRISCGVVFSILTLYTFVSIISFLFTWANDQSLLTNDNLLSTIITASNRGGKIGFIWANFLVSKLFGLGAFVVPFFFLAVSVYCFKIRRINLLRFFFLTLMGCIVASILCSFIFSFTDLTSIFGEGAGGSYGYYMNEWLVSMVGNIGTGSIIFFLLSLWLMLLSDKIVGRITRFFDSIISKMEKKESDNSESLEDEMIHNQEEEDEFHREEPMEINEDISQEIEISDNQIFADTEKEDSTYEETDIESEEEISVTETIPPLEVLPSEQVNIEIEDDEWKQRYDPRLTLSHYNFPTLSLLDDYKDSWYEVSKEELETNNRKIVTSLKNYKIDISKISAKIGPTVTLYEIVPAPGVRVAQIKRLEEDIAISLAARGVRVVTLVGSNAIGIEVANEHPSVVSMKSVLDDKKFRESKFELPIALGRTISNEVKILDLAKMPHLLVAGATGQGKSVGLNAIITSLLYKKHPAELKFVLVDPKKVELSLYEPIKNHYLAKLPDEEEAIITDTQKVVYTLRSLCILMDHRYDLLKSASVRNVKEYNEKFLSRKLNPEKGHDFMPYIVVIIDEFADLLMTAGREIEEPIARLAQLARAIGIHLVIATQRPTTNIITGTIKANFPARIAFRVISSIDSKTILDQTGANQLIGRGDMLVSTGSNEPERVQCAFIDTPEVDRLTNFIERQQSFCTSYLLPEYVPPEDSASTSKVTSSERDDLFKEAARLIVREQQGSTSLIQRKMSLGYNRAGRIIDQLEEAGIVGPSDGSKARQVRITSLESLEQILSSMD